MAKNNEVLDGLIESAEDALKTLHRAASAKGASWSPEDRKALKEWAEALGSLTTVKAMRKADERGEIPGYAYGMPVHHWDERMIPDYAYGFRNGMDGMSGRNRIGTGRNMAYGMEMDDAHMDARRRTIADLTRLRDSAPDDHTRMEYARILSHEYGVTG